LLVLTGVTTAAGLLAAPPQHRPSYLGHDVSALLQPHPEVVVADGVVRCRSSEVRAEGNALVLTAAGDDDLDSVRALATAAWQGWSRDELRGANQKSNAVLR